MNIAVFASAFWPHVGGVEELCRQLGHALVRKGHGVVVVTNRWPKDLPEEEEFEGLEVRRFAFRVPERRLRHFGGAMLYGPGTARELCRYLERRGVDLMHVQCVSSNAHYALKAKRRLGLPLVVTLQGELTMDASQTFQRSAFARTLMRRALEGADTVTACSSRTLLDAEAFLGRPMGDRGRVIFNGIRMADFAETEAYDHGRPYVFAIGRHVTQKGFDLLIRAFCKLEGIGGIDLIIAGDGPEHGRLRQMAAELGGEGRIHFTGPVSHAKAVTLFKGCRVFVLPSRLEPFGIVNLEAMAAGKPVLATRVGGVGELIADNETGVLVPPEDVNALARELGRLLADEGRRQKLGRAGMEYASEFDWDRIAERYIQAYEMAMGRTLTTGCGNTAGEVLV